MNEDSKKPFINRHGHRADMNRIDLSGISVENDGTVPAHELTEPQQQSKPVRRRSAGFHLTKQRLLIIAGIVIVLLLLPVIAGEIVAASYRSDASAVTGKLNKLISDKVLPSQQKITIKVGVIGEMAAGVDDIRSSTCGGGLLDNLAMLYPRAKSAHTDCVEKNGQLSDLSSSLKKLEAENRYIDAVLNATKTVTAPLAEPFAVVDAQQTNWVAARDAIKKLSPPTEWQEQHTTLTRWVSTVAEGWTALNAASGAQDKTKFESAEKDLNSAYEGIRSTVDELMTTLHQTQNTVTTTRKALQ